MRLIERHLLADFLRLFAILSIGLSAIVSVLDLVKRIDDLLPHGPSLATLALYAAYSFPRYFLYTVPVGALLAALYAVGLAARNRELMAVMAAGGRLGRLLLPIVAAGALLSAATFLVGELAVPAGARAARALKNEIMGRPTVQTELSEGRLWLRARDGSVVRIGLYIVESDSFREMGIFRFGPEGVREIVMAEEARYEVGEGVWLLREVRVHRLEPASYESLPEMRYTDLGSPEVFAEDVTKPYELGFFDLRRYIGRLEEAGFRNVRLQVELYAKATSALSCLFMTVLGVALATRRSLGGLVAAAMGIVVSLGYWLLFTLSLSLGYAGVAPPALASAIMPILFGGLAARLYLTIPE
jgi:lipopolysaccharide export system permease protein